MRALFLNKAGIAFVSSAFVDMVRPFPLDF